MMFFFVFFLIFAFECYVSISFHWFARYSSRYLGRTPSRSRGLFAWRVECTWICPTRQKHELAIFSTVGVLDEMSLQATNLIRALRRAALAINYKSENRDQRTFVSASYLVDEFAPNGDVCGKCISFRPF